MNKLIQRAWRRIRPHPESISAGPDYQPYVSDLSEAYSRQWHDVPCVFVLSTGRVGTHTLSALLDLSDQVQAHHEPSPRLIKTSFDAFLEYGDGAQFELWKRIILAARDEYVVDAAKTGRVYIETNNRMTYLAPALARIFPDSRFIHLFRDPFDVIRSAMRRNYYAGHGWDFARIEPRSDDPDIHAWAHWRPIQKAAWYWATTNRDILAFLDTLPPERRLSVRAETLFQGEMRLIQKLFRFAGVAAPALRDIEDVLKLRLNAQKTGSFPAGHGWSGTDRSDVTRIVAPVAEKLSYVLS